ncbi:hypothetical protein OG864_00860 [Streptomyces sp. NBC_00124]|uniref:hypothetical protein n=1 Tax=Streptomyces sp. NBC_00124 TaxID=2975662 RepID=UPI0022534238|nr:hypothetical protein [Streptomyces sp. NBC_00124]MCX5357331.1 hypothetical protein [Streptomyces sp. NBC_00124]
MTDAILTTRLRFSAQAHVGMAGLGRNDRWLIRQVLDDFTSGDLPLGRIHLTSDRSPNGELWHLASVVVRDGLRALINITPADDIMPERYQVLGILTAESDLVADTQTLLNRLVGQRPVACPASVARRAVTLASGVAGSSRTHLNGEWLAILAGSPEEGITLSSRQQACLAAGFLLAAIRMRVRDLARPAWRPVDWLLRTEPRTNGLISVVVGAQAIYIVGDGGLSALVTEVWEPCGIAGAAMYVLSRWLRRVRGIEVAAAEREPGDE